MSLLLCETKPSLLGVSCYVLLFRYGIAACAEENPIFFSSSASAPTAFGADVFSEDFHEFYCIFFAFLHQLFPYIAPLPASNRIAYGFLAVSPVPLREFHDTNDTRLFRPQQPIDFLVDVAVQMFLPAPFFCLILLSPGICQMVFLVFVVLFAHP